MRELREAIAEVRRERMIRATVYPRLVVQGKLTQGEADRRLMHLQWAQAYLEKLHQCPDLLQVLTDTVGPVAAHTAD